MIHDLSHKECYDGSQIKPLWALRTFDMLGDSIIVFRGDMRITQDEMIDVRDIVREKDLADILISGDDCLHFIVEMFDDQPANLKIAYHRLHLLTFIVQRKIEQLFTITLEKKGTDLYFQAKKLNVAIATSSNNSTKIHFGINLVSKGVPKYVAAIGLYDISTKIDLEKFARNIAEEFVSEVQAISDDVTKSRTR
ncbi:MAG: DUF366 family protein [Candidatus Heimdallarchaeota archaeon]|nr:DUF366 family protein [Candidatus Heimdallarchaeota archaeon]